MRTTLHFSSWVRLVALSLLLGFGLAVVMGSQARPAHAQTTLAVTDCSSDAQLQADVAQANTDNASDTITFACSGDIKLTSTLTITGSMTIDGSGQNVIIDGNNQVQGFSVTNLTSLTLNALTIAHGFTGLDGGGLANVDGTVTINNSTIASNSAYSGGGLIDYDGTVTINNSTIASNSASSVGGGLANVDGMMTINNSTVASNSASRGGGGLASDHTLTINNSTIASNSAYSGGGGGLLNESIVNIGGSIVAENTGGDCSNTNIITDQGYNLSSDSSCGFTGTGDKQNTNPLLDPNGLQNNGGPTQTIALLQNSPAIDTIPAASCPATDQRGMTRPDAGESTCDMGAYESNYVDNDLGLTNMPANITTNATSPQGAVVTYTPPTVVDEDSPLPPVSCTPTSGSTFAIGTTTVTCTVSDSDDTNSPVSASFTVTVNGAATQISNLETTVNDFQFKKAIQTTLDAELQVALSAVNQGKTKVACASLDVFVGEVKLLTGHGITSSQASQLVAAAKQIQAVLGC